MINKSNDMTAIKVGVVDDHASVTRAFILLLNSMPGIRGVLEAVSGQHLLDQLKTMTELPDILLMDVDMKTMNGIEATKRVTDGYPTIKVIALSAKDDDWSMVQMLSAGACAYLSKGMSADTMAEAITEVYRNGKYQADLYHLYSTEIRRYSKDIQDLFFTENEKRYLLLLSKGYSYARIAETMRVTVDGVKYFFSSISEKLNTKNQALILLEALRMGIVPLHERKK
jgi:DNA-binding NarL/FixJ family response regulator